MEPTWTPMASARKPAPPMAEIRGAFAAMGTGGAFLPHRGSRGYCLAGRCWTASEIASRECMASLARQRVAAGGGRLPAWSAGAAGRSGSRTLGPAGRGRSPPACRPEVAEEPGPGTGGGRVPWRPGCPWVLAVAAAGSVLRAADVDAVAVPDDGSAGVAFADAG